MVFLISQTNGCTYTLDGNHQTLLMYHPLYEDGSYETNRGAYEYVEWDELRDNFKDYFNVILLKKTQEDESFKNLGELGILVTGFAGKFIEYTIDSYLNPEGLSLLLEKSFSLF